MAENNKPIIPNEGMTLYQRQRCGQRFKEQAIKAISPLIKGTGWRRKSAWVFKVEGDWYLTAFITGGTTPDGMNNLLNVSLGIKPMAVDPINWRAKGLHENLSKPPSFRSNAAFKVPALPIAERSWCENLTDVEAASQMLAESIFTMADEARRLVKEKAFSQLVREHKNAENYTALFVASLISEGCGDRAIDALKNHYGVKDDIAGASDTIRELVISYQHVIDGTDDPVKRPLVTDIHGNSVIDSPVSRAIENAPTKRRTIWSGLNSALRGTKK